MGRLNNRIAIRTMWLCTLILTFFTHSSYAQEGFGTSTPNKDAVVDLNASNKGLLLPRVTLINTTSFSPLTKHVTGMVVYNTANAGTVPNVVTPGIYFNDGTKWIRFYDDTALPWNNVLTQTAATTVNQDVYQLGNVGIGVGQSIDINNSLKISAAVGIDPIKSMGLSKSPDTNDEKIMMIDPVTGEVRWVNFSAIKTGSYQSAASQQIPNSTFDNVNGPSSNREPLKFAATPLEQVVVPTFMTGGTNGVFTITDGGLFDIFCSANLSIPPTSGFATTGSNSVKIMAINFNIEKLTGGVWVAIANTRTNMDTRAGQPGSPGVMSLTPLNIALQLNKNDQIRFVVQRANSYYVSDTGSPVISFVADASKGVPISKSLRIIRLQ